VNGIWTPVTWREFAEQVHELAAGFIAAGIRPGDRVALMSRTRYEWTLLDYAILTAGGVVVPVYPTSSVEQVEWILGDSGAVAAVIIRHYQVPDLLPVLASGAGTPEILFFGNLWTSFEPVKAQLGERFLWGFPVAGGGFEGRICTRRCWARSSSAIRRAARRTGWSG
jgi:hypothetical protein